MGALDYQKMISDFKAQSSAGAWPHLDRAKVADNLQTVIECPDAINQGATGLCGPAPFFHFWIDRDPAAVAQYAVTLFETGKSTIGTLEVQPCDALLQADYPSLLSQYSNFPGPAEWMMLGSLRNSDAFLGLNFEGAPAGNDIEAYIREGTFPAWIIQWLGACGSYNCVSDHTSKIALPVNVNGFADIGSLSLADALRDPPDARTDVIWMVNSELIPPFIPGTSGIADHFVAVLRPLKQLAGDRVGITCFTWGRAHYFECARAFFESHYYGAITAHAKAPRVVLPIPPAKPVNLIFEREPGSGLRISWSCWSPNDVRYGIYRRSEFQPAFGLQADIAASDPPTIGTNYLDPGMDALEEESTYRVRAISPYGTADSDDVEYDNALFFRLARWFAWESVYLARLGGYDLASRNQVDAIPHYNWAVTQTEDTILKDLREKYALQFGCQLSRGIDAACDFFADSVMRYLNSSIAFDPDACDEGDPNSLNRQDHWEYAHNLLTPFNAPWLDRLKEELGERPMAVIGSPRTSHNLMAQREELSYLFYVSENVRVAASTRLSGTEYRSTDPAFYFARITRNTAQQLIDGLVDRTLAEMDSLYAFINGAPLAADFYARTCLCLNAYAVDLGSLTGNSGDPEVHRAWAAQAPAWQVRDALSTRARRVFEVVRQPEAIPPRPAVWLRRPDGSWGEAAHPYALTLPPARPGSPSVGTIRVRNTGGGTFFVAAPQLAGAFNAANTAVSVPWEGVTLLHDVDIQVRFTGAQAGKFEGRLQVETGAPGVPHLTVALSATVLGACLTATPASVDFGVVKAGTAARRTVRVTNTGTVNADLRDYLIQPQPGPFDASGQPYLNAGLAPAEFFDITVSFTPQTAGAAIGSETVRYRTFVDDPLADLQIPLAGRGAAPRIRVPPTLDLGRHAPGTTAAADLLVGNQGESDLVLSGLILDAAASSSGFALVVDGAEWNQIPVPYFGPPDHAPAQPLLPIAPGGSLSFEVRAHGLSAGGPSAGALSVSSDDPGDPKVDVRLRAMTSGPARISVNPERIDFGTVTAKPPIRQILRISNPGFDTLEITRLSIQPKRAGFTADFGPPQRVAPGGHIDVTVAFVGERRGAYRAALNIDSNADKRPGVAVTLAARR